ncbi:hypothetical protein [Litorimonas sp.]|uniref:hypothetical protein n=1 Tax=Litorimonas sp. TaxID=1892381 RepID=UPI003A86687B
MKQDYEKYDNPEALVADESLSDAKKKELLTQWIEDEEALVRGSAEGMDGGEENHLKSAQTALMKLQGKDT